ncbi:hypothetical protein L1987_57142 [Smallanthus sonchifolius]|uniref:Uncharacterized protein n=1 Tax=Smallanthus sonchifolius TaxID=185202 RepID=A0ACB9DC77_9ASTR|nr:hypothetical protein L1987_57142 [Smallanthus sonchifolius]
MVQESSGRSKYFASDKHNQEDAKELTSKRKVEKSSADIQPPHVHSLNDDDDDDDETGKSSAEMTPSKKLKSGSIPSARVEKESDDTPANTESSRRRNS